MKNKENLFLLRECTERFLVILSTAVVPTWRARFSPGMANISPTLGVEQMKHVCVLSVAISLICAV